MALTKDKERLHRVAAMDLAKKLRLEPFLASDMRRMLKNILKDFRSTYSGYKETVTPDKYIPDATHILRHHYRRVFKAFSGDLKKEIMRNTKAAIRESDIEAEVDKEMAGYIIQHSGKQAKIIIQTTTNDLDDEIRSVIEESIAKGLDPSPQRIADIVYKNYSKKVNGRAKIISITETQSLAEKTKNVEAQKTQESLPFHQQKLKKVWIATLDEVTREWHAEADGQEVDILDSFTVNDEQLQYPGDPEGSPDNIINCRCSFATVE